MAVLIADHGMSMRLEVKIIGKLDGRNFRGENANKLMKNQRVRKSGKADGLLRGLDKE